MTNKKFKTVTIGIPALNEEANIGYLLNDLINQEIDGFILERIIVASDGSIDSTADIVYAFKSNKVVLINGKDRLGKAERENEILYKTNSDVLVLLDADISVPDKGFLKKLITPIIYGEAGMTSAALEELPARTYFEKVLGVSMKLKTNLFKEFKKGNNVYNCHGPARAFVKEMYKQFRFIGSSGEDMYSYLVCKRLGFKFSYVSSSKVLYRLPSNPTDHYKQSSRYLDSIEDNKKIFGDEFVDNEFKITRSVFLKAAVKSSPIILKNIVPFIFYLVTFELFKMFVSMGLKVKDSWGVISSKSLAK